MATQPTKLNGETKAPSMAIIDAISMQLTQALDMMKPPDYVKKAAEDFIVSLKKWSEGNA